MFKNLLHFRNRGHHHIVVGGGIFLSQRNVEHRIYHQDNNNNYYIAKFDGSTTAYRISITKPNRIVVKGQRRKSAPESTSTTPVKETPRALTGSRFSARKSLLDLRPAFRAIKAKNSPKEKKEEEEEETEDDDDDDDDDDATEEPEISTHRSEEILASLRLSTMKTPSIDPCLPNNHKIVQDQPQRSINHHLAKSGDEPPICDRDLERGWYRFESAAGNIMPTECPGGNYCGTNMPIWMKEERDAPPGPNSIPILGSIPFVPKRFRAQGRLHIPKLFNHLTQEYGPIFRIYLGPIPTVVITDLNLAKEAFKKDEVTARPPMKPFHEFRYGSADGNQRGVILSSGLEWQDQRRFSLRQLRDFGFGRSSMESMILEEVQKLCKSLQEEAGKPLDLSFKMNISIINALWLILVGERLELDDERLLKIVRTMDKLLRETQVSGLFSVLFPTLYKMVHPRFKFARDTFESMRILMKQAIVEHKESFQPDEDPKDFIDSYLQEIESTKNPRSSFFKEQGLKSLDCVLIDLFMGGSETTSITLIWTFLFLLHHPEWQEKIHEELDSAIGDPLPTLQDLPALPHLRAVMSETLRLSSVVPNGVPHYVTQDTKVGDYILKKGTSVMANLAGVHLNPAFWETAEEFQPERFLDKSGKFESPDSSHFAPFSVGKRFCLGQSLAEQEYFLFLSGIMQKFKLVHPPGQALPDYRFSDIPSEEEGTVEATGCINRDRECCINELPMQVRNCSKFIVYHLEPTPTCSMGYCIGEGVPCPEGLTSENGYTPCNFTAKLDTVVLSPQVNDNHTEVTFSCQPVIQDAIDRATISVEIEWWVGNMLVSDETFELKDRPSGVLSQDLWKVGHEVRCTALVMHTVTGSGTEKKSSKTFFIGLVVDSETSLILHEGGVAQDLKISSTIPITCPDGRRGRHCCLDLELSEKIQSSGQRCPNRETLDRLAFPLCKPQICEDDFNSSVSISLRVKNDHLINGNETIHLEIGVSGVAKWKDYKLPDQQLQVVSSDVQEFCQISSFLTTFDGSQVQLDQPGIYTIYRHQSKPIEIQAHFFPCSLSKLCTCAVSVRVGDIFMVLDVCTKGHLQVWASTESGTVPDVGEIPRGLELLSVDEGREYRILLPTGGYVSLGSLLTSLRIYASQEDLNQTSGLCGPFNRNIMDDFMKPNGEVACTEKSKLQTGGRFKQPTPKKALKCVPFTKSWSLERKETLFAGYFDKTLNGTLPTKAGTCSCNKQHDKRSSLVHENIEDIGENFEVMDCYAEDLVCFQQQNSQPFLTKAFALGKSPDFRHFTDLIVEPTKVNVESDESVIEQKEVAQIILSTSVQSSHTGTPPEGWTLSTADKHCANFIQESDAADRCRFVPEMDLSEAIQTCRTDLLFTGNFRVATLHLERLKEECRESLFRNTSLWTLESGSSFLTPPRRIADALCLNDCSGNGICDRGTCKCDSDYIGGDCSQTLSTGIHTSEPPPPQVSALTNFGLCDTRTKPCRELTVLGDGLVNHEALKCNLEIYKIRGVASKQLVTDLVMTMPAKFISYQQVLCPLPELDIHHPDDLAKLDFKDNTDHTRIFAKVSLSYGQGPRSAPLDLLLYDSLCWDCDSAGECTAKTKETRCFFAAGTSSIQVFRIGRTISTRVSPDDFRTCTLPKDSGGCDNKIFRYYYNAIERRCKLFVYGGCKGNGNNFLSEIQCLQQCGDESALALLPEPEVTTEIDTCSQIKDEGICTGYVPRFYFNKKLGRCELFSYGGCGGNNNNFESEDNCVAHCGGPSGGGIFSHSTDVSLDGPSPVTIRKSKCNLPLHKGACHATLRRFFFDSDEGRCKLFIFGGCQGNANNFETMEECIEDCSGPNFMNGEKTSGSNIIISTTTLEPTSKPTSLSGSNFQTTNVCELTKSFGTCLTVSFRYFYDFATNTCKRFRYSGCGGNGNNFLSAADCVRTCGGVLAGDKRAPELKVSPRFYETIKHRAEGEIGGYIRSTSTTTTSSTIKPTTMPTTTTVFVESTTTNPPASTAERSTRLRVKQRKRFFPAAITAATTTSIKSTTEPSTIIHKTTTARHHIVRATPIPRGRSRFGTGVRARFVALSATTSTPKPDTETKDEGMMVSTQTSRSTIVRAKPKRPISNDIHGLKEGHDSDESPTPSELMASTGHAHHRFKLSSSLQRLLRSKASDRSNKLRVSTPSKSSSTSEEGEDRETPFSPSHDEEEDPNQTDLSSTSLEASASELRPTTVFRGTNSLFSRRISKLSHVPVIDQVVKAPLTMKGSELVVIHTFCRHSPPRGSQPRCNREKPLYFYNVTSATCEPFYDGYCGRSRNRFPSKAACLSSCIVASENVDSAEAD
eukprot:TCALIF_10496-PA protein Name:"Similar to Cyp2j6 Cytochrome P450 2J6 (Mus musculus)" AED:0.07 eAED:0.07 QI:0/0.78/0.7/0.9/1/1/20/349/2332